MRHMRPKFKKYYMLIKDSTGLRWSPIHWSYPTEAFIISLLQSQVIYSTNCGFRFFPFFFFSLPQCRSIHYFLLTAIAALSEHARICMYLERTSDTNCLTLLWQNSVSSAWDAHDFLFNLALNLLILQWCYVPRKFICVLLSSPF